MPEEECDTVMGFIWKILQDMLLVSCGGYEVGLRWFACAACVDSATGRSGFASYIPVNSADAEPQIPSQEKKDEEWRLIVKTMTLLEVLLEQFGVSLGPAT